MLSVNNQKDASQSEYVSKGFVNYCEPDRLIYSHGKTVYEYKDGKSYKIISLHKNIFDHFCSRFSLYQRLTRSHIHHVIPVNRHNLLAFVSGKIFLIDATQKRIIHTSGISGSQPLQIARSGDTIYYGEYIRSSNKPPINLLRANPPYKKWEIVKTFNDIRHIHGVFHDPFTQSLWITTGDEDAESRIMRLNESTYEVMDSVGGSQTFRAVTLLFTKDYVYYGTDTPFEKNYIYRINRQNMQTERLTEVGGPVFYGTKVEDKLIFSTAWEPAKYSQSDRFELWESDDGDRWRLMKTFKKDFWHNKLFRYGMIFFPSGPGDGKYLWFTTMATKDEFKVFRMPVNCG